MAQDQSIQQTIARVAQEEGIDPSFALAVADRKSSFNPNAHNSKTIHGLFQMTGDLRHKYGAGDSADPEAQTRAFARYLKDLKSDMSQKLGREPSDRELYAGHYWGPGRASRVLSGQHANAAPADMFSPYELSLNPEIAKAKNMGALASNVMGDIDRRQAKYGGGQKDFASYGENPQGIDFAPFGDPENVAKRLGADDKATQPPAWSGSTAAWKPPEWGKAPPPKDGKSVDYASFGTQTEPAMAKTAMGNGTSRSTPTNIDTNVDAAVAPVSYGQEVDLSQYPPPQPAAGPGG